MPLPKIHRVVQDSLGNVVPQVLCSVLLEGTGTLATLWQDDAGTIPLSNPMTSDATYGSFDFYVTPAHYDLTFTKPGYVFQPLLDMQVPQDDLTLGTMAQQDASAVAITGGSATGLAQCGSGSFYVLEQPGPRTAFNAQLSAGTDRWAFYSGGTALSWLAAPLGIQGQPVTFAPLTLRFAKATQNGLVIQPTDSDASQSSIQFLSLAGGTVGNIVTTATTTTYNTSSDMRLKRDVQPLTGALAVVQALRPVHFVWNATEEPGEGFLAHELMRQVPAAVTGQPDEVNEDGSIRPQGVDHSRLVPWLTAALQDAVAQVQALTARVTSLEEQLGV